MSPEIEDEAFVNIGFWCNDPEGEDEDLREIIRWAIRRAQASARNEALEEAAAHLLAAANVPVLGPITVGDEIRMQGAFESASAIRNLKTKD